MIDFVARRWLKVEMEYFLWHYPIQDQCRKISGDFQIIFAINFAKWIWI